MKRVRRLAKPVVELPWCSRYQEWGLLYTIISGRVLGADLVADLPNQLQPEFSALQLHGDMHELTQKKGNSHLSGFLHHPIRFKFVRATSYFSRVLVFSPAGLILQNLSNQIQKESREIKPRRLDRVAPIKKCRQRTKDKLTQTERCYRRISCMMRTRRAAKRRLFLIGIYIGMSRMMNNKDGWSSKNAHRP